LDNLANEAIHKQDGRDQRLETLLASISSSARPKTWHFAVGLLLAAPLPLLLAFKHDLIVNYTFQDLFIPMEAAWRALQGQWPHTDFYSPLGLTYFALHGLAAKLWGLDGQVVSRANFIALPIVLLPALVFAARRLNAWSTVLLIVFLTTVVMSPIPLDGPERFIAYLANYNALGGALCASLTLWALGTVSQPSAGRDAIDSVLAGGMLLLLLFLKITFFVLALVIVATGCVVIRRFWPRALVAGAVVAVGAAALELVHPGLLAAYAMDLNRARLANTTVFRGYHVWKAIRQDVLPVGIVLVLSAVMVWTVPRLWLFGAGCIAVAGACVLVSTQNFDGFSVPVIVVVMVLADYLLAAPPRLGLTGRPRLATAGMIVMAMATLPFLLTHLIGMINVARLHRSQGVVVADGDVEPFRAIVWVRNPTEPAFVADGASMAEINRWKAFLPPDLANTVLSDGFALLRREGLTAERIASLSFSNPFPVGLHAPSPRGVALWWDQDRSYTVKRLRQGLVLGDAQVVMVPKIWFTYYNVSDLVDVVQATLDAGFTPHESQYWTAWVKRES